MVADAKCSCSNTRYTSPGQWHTARKIFHIQNKIFHIENQQKIFNIWRLKTYLNCQSEASHGNPLSSHWQLLSRKIFTVSGLMIFEEDFKSSEADLLKPCQVRFLLLSLSSSSWSWFWWYNHYSISLNKNKTNHDSQSVSSVFE